MSGNPFAAVREDGDGAGAAVPTPGGEEDGLSSNNPFLQLAAQEGIDGVPPPPHNPVLLRAKGALNIDSKRMSKAVRSRTCPMIMLATCCCFFPLMFTECGDHIICLDNYLCRSAMLQFIL